MERSFLEVNFSIFHLNMSFVCKQSTALKTNHKIGVTMLKFAFCRQTTARMYLIKTTARMHFAHLIYPGNTTL